MIILRTAALALLIASCGHVTAVEGAIKVDPSHCRELADGGSEDVSLLECFSGEASVRVELSRSDWQGVKSRCKPGPFDAGPGK